MLFAILLFGGLWGFVGMIVGVPLFAVIYDIIKKLDNGETISEKTIIMDEKGFDATTITQEDVDNYGI